MGKAKAQKGREKKSNQKKKENEIPDPTLASAAALGIEILTLEEAASLLRVSVDGLRADAENEKVPARLIAGEWRFVKHALHSWLGWPQPIRHKASDLGPPVTELPNRITKAMPHEPTPLNAGQLSAIGTMADDETLQAMTDEIYRRRATEE